jgi:hypothetical protein
MLSPTHDYGHGKGRRDRTDQDAVSIWWSRGQRAAAKVSTDDRGRAIPSDAPMLLEFDGLLGLWHTNHDLSRFRGLEMVRSRLLWVGMLVGLVAARVSAQQVTLTMDEVPTQPVHGLSIQGVTFGFLIDGVESLEANYNASNGGIQTYTQDPVIAGISAGVLVLAFDVPTPILKFGVSLGAFENLSPGFFVALFDTNLNPISDTPVDATILPGCCGFPEGQFSYSGTPVRLAVVRFTVDSDAFGFDNLTFDRSGSPVPVPDLSTWGGLGLAALLLGVSVLRVRAAQAS